MTWGYHRDYYTKSTLHFENYENANYDFEIQKAKAKDAPRFDNLLQKLSLFHNMSLTWDMFNNKRDWGLEFSWDHIKYIIRDDQFLHLKGTINNVSYDLDTIVGDNLVRFEHTNGGNYCMINGLKRWNLLHSKKGMHWLSVLGKAGAGVPFPMLAVNF